MERRCSPRLEPGGGVNALDHLQGPVANGPSSRPVPRWSVVPADLKTRQIPLVKAGMGHRPHAPVQSVLCVAHPRESVSTDGHDELADPLQQLILVGCSDQGFVAGRQDAQRAIDRNEAGFRPPALRDFKPADDDFEDSTAGAA